MDKATLLENFNARFSPPEEVAKTFIPPHNFPKISKFFHSLIIGPRGSGKTTILKMLTPAAVHSWNSIAPSARGKIPINYVGVYIPYDSTMANQIGNLRFDHSITGERIEIGKMSSALMHGAFSAFILQAIVKSVGDLIDSGRLPASAANNAQMFHQLAKIWNLPGDNYSLLSIAAAVRERIAEIHDVVNKFYFGVIDTKELRLYISNGIFTRDPIQSINLTIDTIDSFCKTKSLKWAFLFDEFELAPDSIRTILISAMRSTSEQRFVIKLTMAPFDSSFAALTRTGGPSDGNDFDLIPLWYPLKEDGQKFCHQIATSVFRQHGYRDPSPEVVLGHSLYCSNRNKGGTKNHEYEKLIQSLRSTDDSFSEYINDESRRHIYSNISAITDDNVRAQYIRKPLAAMTFRDYFLDSWKTKQKPKFRSRKSNQIYSGMEFIFALTEGNPRWLIGLLHNCLSRTETGRPIDPSIQQQEITSLMNRYRSLLKAYTDPQSQSGRGLLDFIDKFGHAISNKFYGEKYTPDPVLSFSIDSTADKYFLSLVSTALNAGAFIYLPDGDGSSLLSSFKGKEFRICYLLCPQYKLPLVSGRPISHGKLLGNADPPKDNSAPVQTSFLWVQDDT